MRCTSLLYALSFLCAGFLSHSDFHDIQFALWKARVYWLDIGIVLGISPDTLEAIQKSERGDLGGCLTAIIKEWLMSGNPRPTWAALAEALRSVGFGHLAHELSRRHLTDSQRGIYTMYYCI